MGRSGRGVRAYGGGGCLHFPGTPHLPPPTARHVQGMLSSLSGRVRCVLLPPFVSADFRARMCVFHLQRLLSVDRLPEWQLGFSDGEHNLVPHAFQSG